MAELVCAYGFERGRDGRSRGSLPDSVIGTGDIVAEDDTHVVFDLASLATDQMDLANTLNESLPPGKQYKLDPALTFFENTKVFPQNDVITVGQGWVTDDKHLIDTAPERASIARQSRLQSYGTAGRRLPATPSDDRVGIYNDIYLDFSSEAVNSANSATCRVGISIRPILRNRRKRVIRWSST